jgi:hypothetical protein
MTRPARTILLTVLSFGAAAYLSGGALAFVKFIVFVAGILVPIAALTSSLLARVGVAPLLRPCIASVFAIIAATPLFYLRRFSQLPPWAIDSLLVVVLLSATVFGGSLRRFAREWRAPLFRQASALLLAAVPLVFVLVWTGFEVPAIGPSGTPMIRYPGMYRVDFSSLANVTTLVRVSPGLPEFPVVGGGALWYHWHYFTFPAWLADFGGIAVMRSPTSLILCNFATAIVFFASLCAVVASRDDFTGDDPRENRRAIAAVMIVAFAAFSYYAYAFVVARAHQPWLTTGDRNKLLLSVLTSITSFGNNALAIAMILLACALVVEWNRGPASTGPGSIVVAVLMFGLSVAYSATLVMPVALALGAWLITGRLRRPLFVVVVAGVLGIVVLVILRLTHVVGGSSEQPLPGFDHGQFLQNVVFGLAPLVVFVAISFASPVRRFTVYWALMLACVAVPTFVRLGGSRTGEAALSMKIASLLVAAAAPIVAEALRAIEQRRERGEGRLLIGIATIAVVLGVGNAAAMLLQFPAARLLGRSGQMAEMPRDYYELLRELRERSTSDAIVADAFVDVLPETLGTMLVAERRVLLPAPYADPLLHVSVRDALLERRRRFDAWRGEGFADGDASREFAANADYLVVPSESHPGSSWREFSRRGPFALYTSLARESTAVGLSR